MVRFVPRSLVMTATLVWLVGCQLTPPPGLVSCPLPVAEQTTRLLEIAPIGTPRDEVMKRLKEAGVRGNSGQNDSIFYCDVWERSESERWHINVVLLFDEEGKLYRTRPELPGAATTSGATTTASDPIFGPLQ